MSVNLNYRVKHIGADLECSSHLPENRRLTRVVTRKAASKGLAYTANVIFGAGSPRGRAQTPSLRVPDQRIRISSPSCLTPKRRYSNLMLSVPTADSRRVCFCVPKDATKDVPKNIRILREPQIGPTLKHISLTQQVKVENMILFLVAYLLFTV